LVGENYFDEIEMDDNLLALELEIKGEINK
jgi:hypothetical protein